MRVRDFMTVQTLMDASRLDLGGGRGRLATNFWKRLAML